MLTIALISTNNSTNNRAIGNSLGLGEPLGHVTYCGMYYHGAAFNATLVNSSPRGVMVRVLALGAEGPEGCGFKTRSDPFYFLIFRIATR